MKQITTDIWKVEILDKFGQTNTIRYYTEIFNKYNLSDNTLHIKDLHIDVVKNEWIEIMKNYEDKLNKVIK
jgi:hypothetical protein